MSQGAANRREGFSPYNKIYEFGYTVQVNFPLLKLTSVNWKHNTGCRAGSAGEHGDDIPLRAPPQYGIRATIQEMVRFWSFPVLHLILERNIQVLLQPDSLV